jgi:plastocyanin
MISRSKLRMLAATSMALIMGAGCGGGSTSSNPPTVTTAPTASVVSPTPSPSAICSPSGTALEIAAEAAPSTSAPSPSFDKDCLAAPADTRFTIRFDNRDAESHNIDILDFPGGTSLFTGKVVTGPKIVTYTVKRLPAGTYYFRCDIHPLRMHGTFLVGE